MSAEMKIRGTVVMLAGTGINLRNGTDGFNWDPASPNTSLQNRGLLLIRCFLRESFFLQG
jgi:hypothetical protein